MLSRFGCIFGIPPNGGGLSNTNTSSAKTSIPVQSGKPFHAGIPSYNLPKGSVARNLQRELDRLEENIFNLETTSSLTKEEKQARATLLQGAKINALFVGGIAFAVSMVVSLAAQGVLSSAGLPLLAAAGAIGGLGVGCWLSYKYVESRGDKHSALGILGIIGGTVIAALITSPGFVAVGAIMGFSTGFVMAQGLGLGAMKLTLTVLEPTLGVCISQRHTKRAFTKLGENSYFSELSGDRAKEWNHLKAYCEKPMSYSMSYFYANIFSPPIHEKLKTYVGTKRIDPLVRAGHRLTGQLFRKMLASNDALTKGHHALNIIQRLAEKGEFENAASAWENFDQIKRNYGHENSLSSALSEAEKAVKDNYGPRPGMREILSCGHCTQGRIKELKKLIEETGMSKQSVPASSPPTSTSSKKQKIFLGEIRQNGRTYKIHLNTSKSGPELAATKKAFEKHIKILLAEQRTVNSPLKKHIITKITRDSVTLDNNQSIRYESLPQFGTSNDKTKKTRLQNRIKKIEKVWSIQKQARADFYKEKIKNSLPGRKT